MDATHTSAPPVAEKNIPPACYCLLSHLCHFPFCAFAELAIVLVLFTGGLELDVASLQKYIKLTLISGCGQIVIQWSLFMGVGNAHTMRGSTPFQEFACVCVCMLDPAANNLILT
jgi:hypothetical protein|eukprot:Tamp_31493.p2 GENE.Tamp_31493~~Tamp_31493.p2  ORF type:complete len:115 (-),score=10.53 Tamp_31493:117-461(-)